jgi:O-antigen ligase
MTLPGNLLWDNHKDKKDNIFNLLCFVLIASTFFTNLVHIRHFGTKLQLTEIVFFLLLPFVPYAKVWQYQVSNNLTFIKLVLVYLALDLISSLLSHQTSAIAESLGRCYLFTVFLILSYQFSTINLDGLMERMSYTFIFCALGIILLSTYGYLMLAFNRHTPYLMFFDIYPYFGRLYRLRGPTVFPSMLISLLSLLLVFVMGIFGHSKIKKSRLAIIFLLLFVCALLTLSKSILLVALCIVVFLLKRIGSLNKATFIITALFFTLLISFFTHVIVMKAGSAEEQTVLASHFTSDKVLYEFNGYQVLETGYLTLKRVEIKMAAEHPFFGVGTGNFNKRIHIYKQQGLFPKKFSDFDPHCTYLGALVENGIFAAIALLAIFFYIVSTFVKRKDLLTNSILLSFFLIFLVFLIDGISTDILNFRHLWVFLALAFVYLQKTKADSKLSSSTTLSF